MGSVIGMIGPWVIRLVSSTVGKVAATAVANFALGEAEKYLIAKGYKDAAALLDDVRKQLFTTAGQTQLLAVASDAVAAQPPAAVRTP